MTPRDVDDLIRLHFRDTPLALASIVRTGVQPFPIRVVYQDDPVTVDVRNTSTSYRSRTRVRVVEDPR